MLGDLLRDDSSLFERLARFAEPLHQADLQRLGGRHRAAGEYEVEGTTLAQHAWEADRPEVDERHAEPAAENAERGAPAGPGPAAPPSELEAPSERRGLHGRHTRR